MRGGHGAGRRERDAGEELRYGRRTVVEGEVVEDAAVVGAQPVARALGEVAALRGGVEDFDFGEGLRLETAARGDDVLGRDIGVLVRRRRAGGVGVAEDKAGDVGAAMPPGGWAEFFCAAS
ncbi:MAG TPA: hypothetical protein VIJ79_04415 [Acidobacteriaceae bacterium]